MGNLVRHGVDMYKQTINQKNEGKTGDQDQGVIIERSRKTIIHIPKKSGEPKKTVKKTDAGNSNEFLKTTKSPDSESKYRRVAKFLILIGSEYAAKILAELDPAQVSEISKEIALTKIIKPEEKDEIFAEFQALFTNYIPGSYQYSGSSHGGIETARRILYAAKGAEKGEEILNRAIPESRENLFSFLEEFSSEQIMMLLKTETEQTTALILSRLPPKLSAGVLSKLPPESKPDVLRRMAHQKEIHPEVLEQVTAALKEKARHIGGGANDIKIEGMQTLAAILKQGDYSFSEKLIGELEKENPVIGKDLKEKLYTLDDVIYSTDRPIQEKLSLMSETEIAILLKGRKREFSEKILSCVSAGRRQLIREEYEILGAVSKRDCDEAAGEFLSWFRKARKSGEIILYSDEDVYL
jgi:flagellar motor switch protein FliG